MPVAPQRALILMGMSIVLRQAVGTHPWDNRKNMAMPAHCKGKDVFQCYHCWLLLSYKLFSVALFSHLFDDMFYPKPHLTSRNCLLAVFPRVTNAIRRWLSRSQEKLQMQSTTVSSWVQYLLVSVSPWFPSIFLHHCTARLKSYCFTCALSRCAASACDSDLEEDGDKGPQDTPGMAMCGSRKNCWDSEIKCNCVSV